jgi:hypothetical protein
MRNIPSIIGLYAFGAGDGTRNTRRLGCRDSETCAARQLHNFVSQPLFPLIQRFDMNFRSFCIGPMDCFGIMPQRFLSRTLRITHLTRPIRPKNIGSNARDTKDAQSLATLSEFNRPVFAINDTKIRKDRTGLR